MQINAAIVNVNGLKMHCYGILYNAMRYSAVQCNEMSPRRVASSARIWQTKMSTFDEPHSLTYIVRLYTYAYVSVCISVCSSIWSVFVCSECAI